MPASRPAARALTHKPRNFAPPVVKLFREVANGAAVDRPQLRRLLSEVAAGDVVMVTRLDRLARSTRDLLNTLAAITEKKAGFRSLGDAWADTTTAHGRLMLTVLGGLADFKRELIRTRTGEGGARADVVHFRGEVGLAGTLGNRAPDSDCRDLTSLGLITDARSTWR